MIFWILLPALTTIISARSHHENICKKVGENPNFAPELVTGKAWRVYYIWHVKIWQKTCVDIKFKKVTKWAVDRFRKDMAYFLEEQPAWETAMMFARIGRGNRQLLLFADYGPAGRVIGAPNTSHDSSMAVPSRGVPLLSFQLKLLQGGKYLVMADCRRGLVMLAARLGEPHSRPELVAAAAEIGIGEGLPVCVNRNKRNENT